MTCKITNLAFVTSICHMSDLANDEADQALQMTLMVMA